VHSPLRRRFETAELLFEEMAKDPSVPQAIREAARRALEDWLSLTPQERKKRVIQFLEDLEYSHEQFGREVPRRPRTGRPPHGALPIPDETPFWPAARRRRRE